jgi:predicted DCC family thiol-disulfide oxidoreductase YuxK
MFSSETSAQTAAVLTIYYDSRCGLCRTLVDWLSAQRQLVPLHCEPMPPQAEDLRVVADTGEEWVGNAAWLTVLWALTDYRDWAIRLGSPLLLPLARQAFATLSRNRTQLSSWLGLPNEQVLAHRLRHVEVPACKAS